MYINSKRMLSKLLMDWIPKQELHVAMRHSCQVKLLFTEAKKEKNLSQKINLKIDHSFEF
jgi:hypothetical protein